MGKKLKHYLEYLLVKFLYTIILNLPEVIIRAVAKFGTFVFKTLLNYRSEIIDKNLSIAFPNASEQEKAQIKEGFYTHITLFFLEFIKGPRLDNEFLNSRVIIENKSLLERFKGKQFILVTAHYGEFNIFLMKITQFIGTHLNIIMKEQRNPYTNQFMMDQRIACNQVPHLSKGALRKTMKALSKGEYIGFLNDQNAGKSGIDAPFFGKNAPTMAGLAIMKEKFDLPILQGYCCREGNGMYRIWLDEITVDRLEDEEKEAYYKRILHASNLHLEKAIERYPDQYLWSHRRWDINNYE